MSLNMHMSFLEIQLDTNSVPYKLSLIKQTECSVPPNVSYVMIEI